RRAPSVAPAHPRLRPVRGVRPEPARPTSGPSSSRERRPAALARVVLRSARTALAEQRVGFGARRHLSGTWAIRACSSSLARINPSLHRTPLGGRRPATSKALTHWVPWAHGIREQTERAARMARLEIGQAPREAQGARRRARPG